MTEIVVMPVNWLPVVLRWRELQPLLDKAMPVNLGRYGPEDILVRIIQGTAQPWFIAEDDKLLAVMVTTVDQYPRRRGLSVFALAGERMSEWFAKAEEVLIEYGRKMGCDHFECQGRKGWERVLDLEPRSTFLVKEIPPLPVTVADKKDDGGADA